MNVLVLDGNQNQAVASVRSLARAGYLVCAGESASWSKAGWSCACRSSFRYPAPQENVDAFVEAVGRFVHERPGTLVLPMTEATTIPLSIHRDFLTSAGARLVLPEPGDLCRAYDKDETTRLAASLGVAIPKTRLVASVQEAHDVAQSVGYPVVLKPRTSEELGVGGKVRSAGRPRYASDPAQLEAAYRDISLRSSAVLLQEFVAGEGTGYFVLMNHGELRAEFAHKRIRDVYPTGSGSAVRISVKPDPEIRRCSLAILSALRWHGVAMVEYRQQAGSRAVFMEVNGRFWHSLPLACYAGVDFPVLLARLAEHGDVESNSGYSFNVRCRWFLGDVRHLVEVWKGPPAGYPGTYPGRLGTLFDVLTPVPGTYHDLFQWRDPLPEFGDWVGLFRRLPQGRNSS
jgi:predicted ATP-grasp superfamily ATP-dependent carboligase